MYLFFLGLAYLMSTVTIREQCRSLQLKNTFPRPTRSFTDLLYLAVQLFVQRVLSFQNYYLLINIY